MIAALNLQGEYEILRPLGLCLSLTFSIDFLVTSHNEGQEPIPYRFLCGSDAS